MKFFTLVAAVAVLLMGQARAGLIISEVVDGDLSGGTPKFLEVTNTSSTPYTFGAGGIIVQSNADTDLTIDVPLAGVTIPGLDSYVIANSGNGGQTNFESTYGFPADLYWSSFAVSNGDDRYILALGDDGMGVGTDIADIHGEIDTDGTGEVWEYTDGYAYRLPSVTTGNGGVYVHSEWFTGGVDSLDGGDAAADAVALQTLTTPGTHAFTQIPEPSSILISLMAASAIGAVAMRRRLG